MEVDFTQGESYNKEKDHANSVVIPEAYICPLTQMIINDPVIFFDDGLTYEQEALMDWIQNKKTNPLTKKPLKQTGTFPNSGLKNLIQKFLTTHGNHPAIKARCYKTKQHQLDQTWLLAAKKGHIKALKKVYNKGANPLTQDAKGNTACHLACLCNNPIKMLEAVYDCVEAYSVNQDNNANEEDEKNTDLNVINNSSINAPNQQALQWMHQTNHQKQTALHVTVAAAKLEWAQLLIPQLITTYAITVDAPDKAGQTALHYAAKQSAKPLLRILIQADASLDSLDNQEKTPLNLTPKLATWMRDECLTYLKQANQVLKRQIAQKNQQLIEAEEKIDDLDAKYQAVLKMNTQMKADNSQKNKTIQTQQRSLTQLKQEKLKADKHADQLQVQLQTVAKSHQAILALKERSIQQLEEEKKKLQIIIQTLNNPLKKQGNDVDEKEMTQDTLANKWHFFEKPIIKIDPKVKKQIDRALELAKKVKEFTQVNPLINTKTARYIHDIVYTSDWLKAYFTPDPIHYYSKKVNPKIIVNGKKIILKNSKPGYENFSWFIDTNQKFDLNNHSWEGTEASDLRLTDQDYNCIIWDKPLYQRYTEEDYALPEKYNKRKSDITFSQVVPTFKSRVKKYQHTKGYVDADWVGTNERGLVKSTTNLCDLMQQLRQFENLAQDINTAPKCVKK